MGSPHTTRPGGSLWSRLVDAFRIRETTAPAVPPNSSEWRVDPSTETWRYQPPAIPAGFQQIQGCLPDGYDFARLVWQACDQCRIGLIAKIRVTGPWQRHGYGTRMVRFALRDRDGYSWTTTPQSEFAREFFPAVAGTTGVEFSDRAHICEHMRAKEPRRFQPWQPLNPPPP